MARKKRKRDYSSGSCYKNTPESKTWTVAWREGDRREREGGFGSKDEAQKWLDQVVVPNLRAGKPGRPAVAEVLGANTLSVVVERWFSNRKVVSAQNEKYYWKNHLEPAFGKLMPSQLDSSKLAQWCLDILPEASEIEDEYEGEVGGDEDGELSPATVKNLVALVSTLYTDLIDQKVVNQNPAKSLPRSIKRRLKSDHDPATTPFVRHLATVFAIIRVLPEPVNVAYAIGALAGLRTGEVLGLSWETIDLDPLQRKIVVMQQVSRNRLRRPKSKKARTVLIVDALYPILVEYRKRTGGVGMLFRPTVRGYTAYASPGSTTKFTAQWLMADGTRKYRGGFDNKDAALFYAKEQQALQPVIERKGGGNGESRPRYMSPKTLHKALRIAITSLGLHQLTWYCATRHSFASLWVINGGNIKLLQKLMGHHSVSTTEKYARLDPNHFNEQDYKRFAVDTGWTSQTPVEAPSVKSVTEMAMAPAMIEAFLNEKELAA